ncbi:hypothetical protein L195_g049592, partial [Trifolium pratense]
MNDKTLSAIILCLADNVLREVAKERTTVGTITLDEVQSALRTKKLTKLRDLRVDDSEKGLNVTRDRSENEGRGKGKKNRSNSRPKGDNGGRFKCFHCQDPGHF